jgi:hypothetical protein
MSAWLGWLIALACVTIWLGVGFGVVAPRWITAETARDIKRWPGLAADPEWLAGDRRENVAMSWGPALIWPLMVFGLLAKWAEHRSTLSEYELRQRIEQLEREAGIR